MTKPATKGGGASAGASPSYAADHRSYLLTLHYAKEGADVEFATVQASHHNETHRFSDLSSAVDYLLSIAIADRPSPRP